VVHPGVTRTENTPAVIAASAAASGASLEAAERQISARIAIGRIVDAQEVAYVVAFLASPKSVAITGDAIAAGGGAKRGDLLLTGAHHRLAARITHDRQYRHRSTSADARAPLPLHGTTI